MKSPVSKSTIFDLTGMTCFDASLINAPYWGFLAAIAIYGAFTIVLAQSLKKIGKRMITLFLK